MSTLLFLYGVVLDVKLPWLGEIKRPKRPRRLPVVLSREEVHMILAHMEGTPALMARLMYWFFPAPGLSRDPRSGAVRRHHMFEETLQRTFRRTVQMAGIPKQATTHALRHAIAMHLL